MFEGLDTPQAIERAWADQLFGKPKDEVTAALDERHEFICGHLLDLNPAMPRESLLGIAGTAVGAAIDRLNELTEGSNALRH